VHIFLSNYNFRAFRKRSGLVSLHLRSHLIIETNTCFSVSAYLEHMRAYLTIPACESMELDEISYDEAPTCKYDGSIQVHGLRISHVSALREIKDCPARFRLEYRFNFHGGVIEGAHEHKAVVTRGRYSDWRVARLRGAHT
jgi:hypothetical protein